MKTALITVLALSLLAQTTEAFTPGNGQEENQAQRGVVGVWEGMTVAVCPGSPANRCNAQQKVTITLVEGPKSKLSGAYKCAYGNMNCLNMNQTGKVVDVKMTGRLLRLRALMPDGMSCLFNGRVTGDNINGGYSCNAGASLRERGSWRAHRGH